MITHVTRMLRRRLVVVAAGTANQMGSARIVVRSLGPEEHVRIRTGHLQHVLRSAHVNPH